MKLVLIGCGAVGKTLLEMLPICNLIPKRYWSEILIIEPLALKKLNLFKNHNYTHLQLALTIENLDEILNRVLDNGDIVLDASVNVDALAIMRWCNRKNCLYINTSMEDWLTESPHLLDTSSKGLYKRSLYSRIVQAHEEFDGHGPTMVADHGMNPGIISDFAKRGIEDYARFVKDKKALALIAKGQLAEAGQSLGLKVIHITEEDTQTTHKPRPKGTFYNTWSAHGLVAESLDPVQIGYGTHEPQPGPGLKPSIGPQNIRILPHRGMDVKQWSYSPSRTSIGSLFMGCSIPHGEANTLSAYLTTPDQSYRPSVFFVYQPCPSARESLEEMKNNNYIVQKDLHVLSLCQIRDGYDAVGALLLFDKKVAQNRPQTWWCGTILDKIDMAPIGIKYSGPTTIQVAISMLSALRWMIDHPREGFLTPEDLPYHQILDDSIPYLGKIYSGPVPIDSDLIPSTPHYEDFLLSV